MRAAGDCREIKLVYMSADPRGIVCSLQTPFDTNPLKRAVRRTVK